jgi:hypothetical protein
MFRGTPQYFDKKRQLFNEKLPFFIKILRSPFFVTGIFQVAYFLRTHAI